MSEIISKTKLFIGGLDWKLRGQDLRESFSQFGEVVFARVILDRETRRSKGFGFVEFENADDAEKAQTTMNESELSGRTIRVDFAKEDPEKLQARAESQAAEEAAEGTEEENTEESKEESAESASEETAEDDKHTEEENPFDA